MAPLCFAYYCSGHGYGHATRVSAFASSLLNLSSSISVHIVSSAPAHVFADSLKLGAHYRYAEIDPVVVQPVAYRVDRRKSVEVLKSFLEKKEKKVAEETKWLREIDADAVLSDAAFLAFEAANKAQLPSILVTNFTFDSVYSYLSAVFVCQSPAAPMYPDPSTAVHAAQPDDAVSEEELAPLVSQLRDGYLKADLLLRLPGAIPIPGFARDATLPAPDWIDPSSMTFRTPVKEALIQDPPSWVLHPSIPFSSPPPSSKLILKGVPRIAKSAPLLVRLASPDVYTPTGRSRILASIGVPPHLHDASKNKILVVSFGGQVIHKPKSRTSSRQHSISETPKEHRPTGPSNTSKKSLGLALSSPESGSGSRSPDSFSQALAQSLHGLAITQDSTRAGDNNYNNVAPTVTNVSDDVNIVKKVHTQSVRPKPLIIATSTQIFIPGAPAPAAISSPNPSSTTPSLPAVNTIPPTPDIAHPSSGPGNFALSPQDIVASPPQELGSISEAEVESNGLQEPLLLPDDSWIAIVCGVSDAKGWGSGRTTPVSMSRTSSSEGTHSGANASRNVNVHLMPPPPVGVDDEDEEELPAGFYIAPKDIYMPDLMAVGDVLLGKLGYGTVAECVESCTPFIYVSRPLFVEEHGLRLLLDREGVGIEMARKEYEAGEWAGKVAEAWDRGGQRKTERKAGKHVVDRAGQTREMADFVTEWTRRWGEIGKCE